MNTPFAQANSSRSLALSRVILFRLSGAGCFHSPDDTTDGSVEKQPWDSLVRCDTNAAGSTCIETKPLVSPDGDCGGPGYWYGCNFDPFQAKCTLVNLWGAPISCQ